MKAVARQTSPGSFSCRVEIGSHEITADEPVEDGGEDAGPTPQELLAASLASCIAITMEMYAQRKGWEIAPLEVECNYEQPESGGSTDFSLVLRLPGSLSNEQIERLRVIAGKCPVHRVLEGDVTFAERVELVGPGGD